MHLGIFCSRKNMKITVNIDKFLGISPPPAKKRKRENDQKERNKVYDNIKRTGRYSRLGTRILSGW